MLIITNVNVFIRANHYVYFSYQATSLVLLTAKSHLDISILPTRLLFSVIFFS
jgi:hypothetical protein